MNFWRTLTAFQKGVWIILGTVLSVTLVSCGFLLFGGSDEPVTRQEDSSTAQEQGDILDNEDITPDEGLDLGETSEPTESSSATPSPVTNRTPAPTQSTSAPRPSPTYSSAPVTTRTQHSSSQSCSELACPQAAIRLISRPGGQMMIEPQRNTTLCEYGRISRGDEICVFYWRSLDDGGAEVFVADGYTWRGSWKDEDNKHFASTNTTVFNNTGNYRAIVAANNMQGGHIETDVPFGQSWRQLLGAS